MFVPHLLISVGETGAMFTLRETYERETVVGGRRYVRHGSFHHCNLGQTPDDAMQNALIHALTMGLLLQADKDTMAREMRDITRMKKEDRETRRLAMEANQAENERVRNEHIAHQKALIDAGVFPFGKYAGTAFSAAPGSYLTWIIKSVETFPEGSIMRYLAEAVNVQMAGKIESQFHPTAAIGSKGERIEFTATVTNTTQFQRESFNGYGFEIVNVVTMVTEDRVCIVSMSPSFYVARDSVVRLRATVKDHKEYNGQMQTLIQRAKVMK